MKRDLCLIGAPSSAGAYAPGQEKAPAAFRRHGLIPALRQAGWNVRDSGDVAPFRWRPDLADVKAMNRDAVRRTAEAVAARAEQAFALDQAVLVLGGDCTVELGTVAASRLAGKSAALVYIDLDADLNIPDTSDGALDWTGVAHMLGVPGADPELAGILPGRRLLEPSDVLLFAVDNISPPEARTIDALGVKRCSLAQVKADPGGAAQQAVAWAARHDQLLIHLDVDVLSYVDFPIAENVRRCAGLTLRELSAALVALAGAPNWRALTITEVNPDHAPDEAATFAELISILATSLGRLPAR